MVLMPGNPCVIKQLPHLFCNLLLILELEPIKNIILSGQVVIKVSYKVLPTIKHFISN